MTESRTIAPDWVPTFITTVENAGYWSFAEPEVIEPDQEPDDDSDAEVPDVREDTVNE